MATESDVNRKTIKRAFTVSLVMREPPDARWPEVERNRSGMLLLWINKATTDAFDAVDREACNVAFGLLDTDQSWTSETVAKRTMSELGRA
ncbi:hypothetical protein HAP47_0003100 [Bradyrhizobium sp. 41S5]|uniref:hypothetical protein n=1 Tax=Bradyrhizobium sp. 41S5 TaxID=1404443 RepID=UPI00156AC6E4|nr:hypothetical protein [Bradyrhizobium sp. 41S5]UFX45724.1 hypothetical protein HAP47_0003100 [Bradyrhizobium sp. 41S5]